MQGKGAFDRVVGWVDSSRSGGGVSVRTAKKNGPFLARLGRLDRELWQQRADVGARGEPVGPKRAVSPCSAPRIGSLSTYKCVKRI